MTPELSEGPASGEVVGCHGLTCGGGMGPPDKPGDDGRGWIGG